MCAITYSNLTNLFLYFYWVNCKLMNVYIETLNTQNILPTIYIQIMDKYNVPESSFYNVLAGRRHTQRVCEAFRKELLKKINDNPNMEVDLLPDTEDEDYSEVSLEENTPPRRKRKRSNSPFHKYEFNCSSNDDEATWEYSKLSISSPPKKKARYNISQVTPNSPMCVEDESLNSLQENESYYTRSSCSVDSFSEVNSVSDTHDCCDDNEIEDLELSNEQILKIKKIAEVFNMERITKILEYQPSRTYHLQEVTINRKNKRKGTPIRSPTS